MTTFSNLKLGQQSLSTEQDLMKILILKNTKKKLRNPEHFNGRDILILKELPPLAIFHYRNNNSQLSVAIQHNY